MSWIGNYAGTTLLRRTGFLRMVLGLLQRVNPVIRLPGITLVTRADDVKEILDRSAEFERGPFEQKKMLMGEFLLASNPFQEVLAEKHELTTILDDLTTHKALTSRVEEICKNQVQRFNDAEAAQFWVELVGSYVEPVIVRFVIEFFGIDAPPEDYPTKVFDVCADPGLENRGEKLLAQWLRKVGSVIVTGRPAPFGLDRVACASRDELGPYLDKLIQKRWSEIAKALRAGSRGEIRETVLDQMLVKLAETRGITDTHLDWDTEVYDVRRNLIGLVLAGSTPLIKAFVHGLDQLLQRVDEPPANCGIRYNPGAKLPPMSAALYAAGVPPGVGVLASTSDRELLQRLFFEVLRFNPTFPFLARFCPRRTSVASGTDRCAHIPAGSTVAAPPLAAMLDGGVVRQPDTIGFQRPDDNYLHFGWGGHECIGRNVASETLTIMLETLLRTPSMAKLHITAKKADKDKELVSRKLRYDGPAVDSYWVKLP